MYDFHHLFQSNWNIFFKHILDGHKLNVKSINSKINWPQFSCSNSIRLHWCLKCFAVFPTFLLINPLYLISLAACDRLRTSRSCPCCPGSCGEKLLRQGLVASSWSCGRNVAADYCAMVKPMLMSLSLYNLFFFNDRRKQVKIFYFILYYILTV